MAAKGLGSKVETSAKVRSRVWVNSPGRTAGLKETGALRLWLFGRQRRSKRSKQEKGRGRTAREGTTDEVGSQLRAGKARSGRS